jgi:nucleotide-binding universal stress UspA family protein
MKPTHFYRILCPVSFSDTSQRTVEMAAMLAAGDAAELRLFHAVPAGANGDRDAESLIGALFALTRQIPMRVRISAAVGYGEAAQEIREHARLMGADLIVTGIHHRSMRRARGESVALAVTSHAACPVLIVRPTPGRFRGEQWMGFT